MGEGFGPFLCFFLVAFKVPNLIVYKSDLADLCGKTLEHAVMLCLSVVVML